MGFSLFPHQVDGVTFLVQRRFALLADDMGIGKTPQAIVAAEAIGAKRITVVCPAILRKNWADEFRRWHSGNLLTTIVDEGQQTVPHEGVVIVSTDLAAQPAIHQQLASQPIDVLICDETKDIKERATQRTRAVMGPALDGIDGIAGKADHVWFLNATPVLNHPGELYPMLKLFGVWTKDYVKFLNTFCKWRNHAKYGVRVTGVQNTDVLRGLLQQVVLRRRKRDVALNLPPLQQYDVPIEAIECDPVNKFLTSLQTLQPLIADKIKRAIDTQDWGFDEDEQISRVRRLIGLCKVAGVSEMLRRDFLAGMYKCVLFGVHRDVLEYLRAFTRDYRPFLIYGGTAEKKRQHAIETFQGGDRRLFFGQIKTAGVGLTLTAAQDVVLAESSWTPAENDQAIMRVHRIGQTFPVRARRAVLANSLDNALASVNLRKRAVIEAIFER